jgi:hypothetical protein
VGGTSGNLAGTIEIGGSAGIGTITVSKGSVVGATISATHTSGAGVKSVTVGGGSFTGQILSAGTGGIGTVSVPKGGFTGSLIAQAGGVKSVTIGGSAGHFAGQIVADGSAGLGTITLNGSATGTISAGHAKGGIKSLTVNGGITNGTVISQGTSGVGTMTVKGNADVDLTVPQGQVGSFTLTGTTASKLSGTWKILGIKTFKGTLGELSDFVLTAGTAIGSFTASGSMTGHSSLMAASVGTISIQGNLMSDEKYAILVNGDLGKTSKVDIGGTATYGAGAGGAGTNRIKIDGELDGLITVGSKITDGMFGDVVVTNALGGSTGKLVADQRNNTALFYYPNTQGAILFTCGKTTGDGCALLFNSWAWPET